MVWVIALKKSRRSDFASLRWYLLLSYLAVIAVILGVFAAGVYLFFVRSFYQQLDGKLRTLAQAAAPSLLEIETHGREYLEQMDAVPWRDIFKREQQSLEWFNAKGQRLARRGQLSLALAPKVGPQMTELSDRSIEIRTFTIAIFKGSNKNKAALIGYIRASQSTEALLNSKTRLLWGLGIGGILALALAGVGGLWLTQKAIEPIEKSFKQLKQFTADASHELRSPLTAIKASVDVVLSHPERIHPKDTKKLAAISSATAQMKHLVDDLLFLARTDTPTSVYHRHQWKPIALNFLLQEILEFLEPSVLAKELTLSAALWVEVFVYGDHSQLLRLFSNLVENAIQYTPSGGKITLSLLKQNRFALVRVKDTGIGIEQHQLALIFDRFWRADQARTQRQWGTGLGLSIAQAIALQHGGIITVSSQPGLGSCFQVRLPLML